MAQRPVKPSAEERSSGILAPSTLAEVVNQVASFGYVRRPALTASVDSDARCQTATVRPSPD